MSAPDPLRSLQRDALLLARHLNPCAAPDRVKIAVLDAKGEVIAELMIPLAGVPPAAAEPESPEVRAGWDVTERRALYDGRPVKVVRKRLKLLKALAETDEPLTAAELIKVAFDHLTSEGNVRFHVGELRKELAGEFEGFEGDLIEATGDGYRLTLR